MRHALRHPAPTGRQLFRQSRLQDEPTAPRDRMVPKTRSVADLLRRPGLVVHEVLQDDSNLRVLLPGRDDLPVADQGCVLHEDPVMQANWTSKVSTS